ncbi:MAG: KR domain-containing protein [Planctomycetaceae bacterium]|nr:KR domain-containing protein [Planctomycetaceae bacterium]
MVCGQAHVFFLLKRLSDAVADGNTIHGVLRGIGVSTDGKGKSLWAPLAKGQTKAILRAYENGANPDNLRFIEAHATSTHLGDATELTSIGNALNELLPDVSQRNLHIGSVKANVGHTLNAAGAVGLLTALLVLKNKTVPPQINVCERNKDIAWEKLPLHITDKPVKIEPNGKPVQIGVDSFGIGGINVYAAVEEFIDESVAVNEVPAKMIVSKKEVPKEPIAVIGMGCILPGANNIDEFWNLLDKGIDPKTELSASEFDRLVPQDEENLFPALRNRKLIGGFIRNWQYDWKKHKVPPKQVAMANPLQFMILDAVDQALEDSGYKTKEFDRSRTAVVVGTASVDDFSLSLQMGLQLPEILDALKKSMLDSGLPVADIDTVLADYKKRFFEKLPSLLDETGSFTQSTLASRITKTFDLMGGAISLDSSSSSSSSSSSALDNAVKMLRSGECSMVICAAGQRHLGYDIFRETAQRGLLDNEDGICPGEGVAVVLLKPLKQAEADGDKIYGVIHSVAATSGTEENDVTQRSIEHSLQEVGLSQKQVKESTIKELAKQIGDVGAGLGIAELCKVLLTMNRRKESGLSSISLAVTEKTKGFSLAYNIVVGDGRLQTTEVDSRDFVATKQPLTAHELPSQSLTVKSPTAKPLTAQPLTALMFPGQGSQYKGMLKPLANVSPKVLNIIAELDETLRKLNFPSFETLAWNEPNELGKDIFQTQLSLLVCDTVFARLLDNSLQSLQAAANLSPSAVLPSLYFGHSYGEYPALVAAGAWDFETAAIATKHRCDAIIAAAGKQTGMLSTNANSEHLELLLPKITSGKLYISNRNTPEQTVVSGERKALEELDAVLKREKWMSLILSVPAGFHSPLVSGVCEPLRKVMKDLPLRFPQRTFLSGVTGKFEAEPETLRNCFVEQMVMPVDFTAMIRKAYANGVRRFIEVGPKSLLCKMGAKILNEYESDAEFIACDLPKQDGEKALDHLEGLALEVSGAGKNREQTAITNVNVQQHEMTEQEPIIFNLPSVASHTSAAVLTKPVAVKFKPKTETLTLTTTTTVPLPVISREEYLKLNTSENGKEPLPVPFRFNRFVLRLLESPLPLSESQDTFPLNGAALIVADEENHLARTFAEKLSQNGIKFFVLPTFTPLEKITAELETFDKTKPLSHLFFLQTFNPSGKVPSGKTLQENVYRENTDLPFTVLQSWVRLMNVRNGDFTQCSVLGALNLGGDFGLVRQPQSVYSGALSGMLKALRAELFAAKTPLRVKLVDFAADEKVTEISEQLFRETIHWDKEHEVAYNDGKRYSLRPVLQPLTVSNKSQPETKNKEPETWLITGGARGITAAIALELGKRRNVKLHLVGSSPLPKVQPEWKTFNPEQLTVLKKEVVKKAIADKQGIPARVWEKVEKGIEIDRNLESLRQTGVAFQYHSCDVSDSTAVHHLLAEIKENITGVIHGAGFEQARSLEKKKPEDVRRTFDVKVKGAATLWDELELQHKRPKVFIGFSSISGRFGAVGQIDYGSANEFLAKLLDKYDASTDCRAFCLQWPAWGEIGMAARPESKFALTAMGLDFMPPQEGIAHVLNEIETTLDVKEKSNSPKDRELCIVDWDYYKRLCPDETANNNQQRAIVKEPLAVGKLLPVTFVGDNADTDALHNTVAETDCPVLFVTAARDPRLAILGKKKLDWFITESLRQVNEWLDIAEHSAQHCRLVVLTALTDYPAGQRFVDTLKAKNLSHVDIEFVDLPAETAPKNVATQAAKNRLQETVTRNRLIAEIVPSDNGFIAKGVYEPAKDVFLIEHRLNGKPILPLVAILETFAETVNAGQQKGFLPAETFIGFEDIVIRQGMICRTINPYHFKIHCTPAENGWQTELLGDFYNTAGKFVKDNLCYTKALLKIPANEPLTCSALNFQPVSAHWDNIQMPAYREIPIFHGKPLSYLKRIHRLDAHRCIAEILVPDTTELFGHTAELNGAVIDAAFYACGVLYWISHKAVSLPRAIQRFVIGNGKLNPGEKCFAHVAFSESKPESDKERTSSLSECCVTLRNKDGEIVYDITGFKRDVLPIDNK